MKRLHYVAWYEVKRRSNDLEDESCLCPQALEVEHYLVTFTYQRSKRYTFNFTLFQEILNF